MEPQRYLRCMGHPALLAPTGEPIRLRTRKHLALLVYLAVEGRSHRRDRLAELLWPKVSTNEARHSLATALSTLRPRLGTDGLETSRDHVRLVPGTVRLDLDRLQAGDVLGTEVTEPLEVAAFLDGFDIADSAEFTHWKDRQQARLLPIIKDALLVLIDRCRRTGDTRQIERLADRMLALDDLSEEAIRAKMEARAFAGDRLTALEIFEEWKAKLAEDLQAVPSELVEGMAIRLRRRGWERTTLANIPNVPTDQWRGRPFIGRNAEYRVLYELWEKVRRGTPGHALILGDSGIGKTTLVQRLTTAAGLEGAAISRVQCYDLEREIPYSTLNGLILGLLDRPGVSATSPEALGELSKMVPEVRHRYRNIPEPTDSHGETARIRLTEAFLEMLTTIAEEHPTILIVDDLHFADDVSLAVLHLIIRRAEKLPIMVLLVARAGELEKSTQAARIRGSSLSLGIHEIELLPLTEEESRQILRSLIDSDEYQPSNSEQRAILRASAGYPMVLELLIQDWKISGDQALTFSVDAMTTEPGDHGLAQKPYQKILQRISLSLESSARSVLNLASILGHRLNDINMYSLVDLSPGQTMTGLAALVSHRILRDGAQGLEFANELMRAAAYISVPQALRRVLHGNIADRFIRQHDQGQNDLGLEIAWHCLRAGRINEATAYLLSGARQAVARGALDAAERGLATAMSHLHGSQRADAVLLLGDVLQEQGRWNDSLIVLENQAQQTNDSLTQDWLTVLLTTAKAQLYHNSSEEVSERIQALVNVIKTTKVASLQVAAALTAAALAADMRNQTYLQLVLNSLSAIESRRLRGEELGKLCLARSRLTFQLRDPIATRREIESGLRLTNRDGVPSTTAALLQLGLGAMSCAAGEYSNALIHLDNANGISARLGNDTLRCGITANLALVNGRLGNYARQRQWAIESLSLGSERFPNYHDILASYCGGLACIFMSEPLGAQDFIAKGENVSKTLSPWALQAWRLFLADLLFLIGDAQSAYASGLKAIKDGNAGLKTASFAGAFCRWTALVAADQNSLRDAFDIVSGFAKSLPKYDAIDRAEILASLCYLKNRMGEADEALLSLLRDHLRSMPAAVGEQMMRLGILEQKRGFNSASVRNIKLSTALP